MQQYLDSCLHLEVKMPKDDQDLQNFLLPLPSSLAVCQQLSSRKPWMDAC